MKHEHRRESHEHSLPDLGQRLADILPGPAARRGWAFSNLTHRVDRVQETWTVDVVGPVRVETAWFLVLGEPRGSTASVLSDTLGTLESSTAEGLVEMAQRVIDVLGLKDLNDPW